MTKRDKNKLIKQRIKRMFSNRKRRNDMHRLYVTPKGSQTGLHVSVYNIIAFIKRMGLTPPFEFELSPINYDKLWRQQREYDRHNHT